MARFTMGQIEQLWIANGGNPNVAPTIAAIAMCESGGRTDALNPKPPDYSVGLFQINYHGSLRAPRTARYGSPEQLLADPNRQARAAIDISGNGRNFQPWTTYTSGCYKRFLSGATTLPAIPATQPLPTLAAAGTSEASRPAQGGTVSREGALFKIHIPGNGDITMQRSTARKILGATVLGAGGIVGLAGLFLLLGEKAPGPLRTAQTLVRSVPSRADRAATTVAPPAKDELAARRAARARERRGRAAEEETTSARAAGDAAAEAAGPFR